MLSEKSKHKYEGLGEILIDKGYITKKQLENALAKKSEIDKPLEEILVDMKYVTWEDIIRALAEQYNLEILEDTPDNIPSDILNKIPRNVMENLRIIPLREERETLVVVTDDTSEILRIESFVRFLTGKLPKILLTSPLTFEYLYKTYVLSSPEKLDMFVDDEFDTEETELATLSEGEEENAPIVKLVSMIIHRAIEKEASDIHIEPGRRAVRVRFRIDGMLKNEITYPRSQHSAVVIRVKIMANLDISERRKPQDGKFYLKVGGEQYDFRVSTMPSVHGETVVLRILKVSSANKKLKDLGFNEYNLERISELLSKPYGMILVTGPTGSGKSTTLVAMINELKNETVNIITAEDPVEYTIEGITQCQVRPEIGLTFSSYLRAFLRQDPDIIMVGEIRDRETAQLAVEASMTGHLVLSTLHTNDASSAVDRLLNLGVDPRLVSTSLLGVVAQRLVRKLNPRCFVNKRDLREDLIDFWKKYYKDQYEPVEYIVEEGMNCGEPYKGRMAIGEVLIVDEKFKEKISQGATVKEIQTIAEDHGMRTMFLDGLEKVLKGETTVEEMLRVVQVPAT